MCREFLAAVTEHPWEDRETVIQGSIAAWRACFPHACCANIRESTWDGQAGERTAPVMDADFVHFEGLRELYMEGCKEVTDAAFVHLKGVKRLDISDCTQLTITDDSLKGIEWLGMEGHSKAQKAQARGHGFNVDFDSDDEEEEE